MSLKSFIDSLAQPSINSYKKYGILPSLTVAQGILESGAGKSLLASKYNNLFGIKGTGTAGSVKMKTREESNGKMITVMADFKNYKTVEDSLDDHGKLLNKPRYKKVRAATDYKTAAKEVRAAGYATDSQYTAKLIKIIEDNKLYELDKVAIAGGTVALPAGTDNNNSNEQRSNTNMDLPAMNTEAIGGALNPMNWLKFAQDLAFKAAFFIPGIILLVVGLMFLFGDVKEAALNTVVKAATKGGN